jgi:superfamily I DNA/RNA helicase
VPRPEKGTGDVQVVQWRTSEAEIAGLPRLVKQRIDSGQTTAGEVLIMVPRIRMGSRIVEGLRKLDIPAHGFFQEDVLRGKPRRTGEHEAQQAFTILKLLANPEDRVALRCWCGFGSSTLLSNQWMKLRAHCEVSGESPREALARLAENTLKIAGTSRTVARYRSLQERLTSVHGIRGQQLADAIFPAGQSWSEAVRELAHGMDAEDFDASELLEGLEAGIIRQEPPTKVAYVRVMTLHKAKGLSAELVVVAGCVQGLIPSIDLELPNRERERILQEQRRLFYVAVTRPKQALILSSFVQVPHGDAMQMGVPTAGGSWEARVVHASEFLHDLGPHCPPVSLGETLIEHVH